MQQPGTDIAGLREELARQPQSERLLERLAFALYTAADFRGAIGLYEKLGELSPANATYAYYRGNCHARCGEPLLAIASWKRAVSLDPFGRLGNKARARARAAADGLRAGGP